MDERAKMVSGCTDGQRRITPCSDVTAAVRIERLYHTAYSSQSQEDRLASAERRRGRLSCWCTLGAIVEMDESNEPWKTKLEVMDHYKRRHAVIPLYGGREFQWTIDLDLQ